MAWPMARVEFTRESMICRRFLDVYRQLTLLPAKLIATSAPSSSAAQLPIVCAIPTDYAPRGFTRFAAEHDDVMAIGYKGTR